MAFVTMVLFGGYHKKALFGALVLKTKAILTFLEATDLLGAHKTEKLVLPSQDYLTLVLRTGKGRVIYSPKQAARKIESSKNLSQAVARELFSCVRY
jgi:hypothetical protein